MNPLLTTISDTDHEIIRISNLWRRFKLDKERGTLYRTIRQRVNRTPENEIVALKDVSFTIYRGEKIGIIGNNGSGKSTLLRIVAGLLRSTEGTVEVNGSLVFLAGLGIGMVEELTVRENVILYGVLYGLDRRNIIELLPEIIAWAEIEGFENAKLRMLSSGMRSRLAFSVVRHIKSDTVLLDEALSAGDMRFKEKSISFYSQDNNRYRTFVIVSHDLDFIKEFCTRAVCLHHGEIVASGETADVIDAYKYNRDYQKR